MVPHPPLAWLKLRQTVGYAELHRIRRLASWSPARDPGLLLERASPFQTRELMGPQEAFRRRSARLVAHRLEDHLALQTLQNCKPDGREARPLRKAKTSCVRAQGYQHCKP